MRADLTFEQTWVPEFFCKTSKSFEQLRLLPFEIGKEEIVSQRWHVQKTMNNDVHMIVSFNVVQPDIAWQVRLVIEVV